MPKPKFAAIGEVMLELSHQNKNTLTLAFAGDTYNTAVYLSRFNVAETYYITALGDDPYSEQIMQHVEKEGIHTYYIQQLPDLLAGLYFIRTNEQGERKFYYYRNHSAARQMFKTKQGAKILKQLPNFDYIYLSGITLAILDKSSRQKLYRALSQAKKRGSKIYFDSNHRPRLWLNVKEAKKVYQQFLKLAYGALPTFSDEQLLYKDKTPEATAKRLLKLGIKEVVVKCGEQGALVATAENREWVPALKVEKVVDTTAAGDSFNAGYLAGNIKSLSQRQSATQGHELAARVIEKSGAIVE